MNCDNRVVASVRLRWEALLDRYAKSRQQGFLKGRSILKNLVEVENEMLLSALHDQEGAAIFLDFAAAFPSISQELVRESLLKAGAPQGMINAFS